MQLGILEPKHFSLKAIDKLSEIGEVSQFLGADLRRFLSGKSVLFVRLGYFVDSEFLDSAESLKVICTPTTGLNHIDMGECQRRGVLVLSLKGETKFLEGIRATPEHTFGLILSLLRNYKMAFLGESNFIWDRELYKGEELQGKTVGIVGMGRVGKILAQYLEVFGAKVVYFDIDQSIIHARTERCGSLSELICKSDIVTLTASYSEGSKGFFNVAYIDLLKGKYFINTARGELIDEEYLLKKIKDNIFRGVALDVVSNESKEHNNIDTLLSLVKGRNLIVTSHIAGATYDSMWKTEEFIAEKLMGVLR